VEWSPSLLRDGEPLAIRPQWWARLVGALRVHELTILPKKFEDVREAGRVYVRSNLRLRV